MENRERYFGNEKNSVTTLYSWRPASFSGLGNLIFSTDSYITHIQLPTKSSKIIPNIISATFRHIFVHYYSFIRFRRLAKTKSKPAATRSLQLFRAVYGNRQDSSRNILRSQFSHSKCDRKILSIRLASLTRESRHYWEILQTLHSRNDESNIFNRLLCAVATMPPI